MPALDTLRSAPEDVILRDGTTLRLRGTTPDDADALVEFFDDLSPDSRYLRFHGTTTVTRQSVEPFLHTSWRERGSLLGELSGPDGRGRVVGLATYVRLREPSTAEVAFAVGDRLQGRGIGTRLLERLAAHAASVGIAEFLAEVLPQNAAMLGVFRDAGFEVRRTLEGGVVEVRLRITATAASRERMDERDHVAVVASLRPFFTPRGVVVMGASARRGTIGGELFRNILDAGFHGAAYPVNRAGDSVAGVRGWRSLAEIEDALDLAVICLPAAHVLDAATEALEHGIRALCVISAGFAETGLDGVERQQQLLALVRAYGARLVGPNCLGIAATASGLNATFAPRAFPPGRIGFSSQSGALGLAILERADARGLGLSAFASIGNKADVSSNDLLEWWEDDPGTDLVMLYLESFGNPRRFARIARRLARRKPILVMKSGTTSMGARAASSHTAALAGSDVAVDALCRQAGVLRAHTFGEFVDLAALLSSQPVPQGRRVAVATNAGGLGILCADACEEAGLELPRLADSTRNALALVLPAEASRENPVDMLGSATAASYEAVLPLLLADPGIDAVIALFVPPVVAGAEEVAAAISRAATLADGKPLLACVLAAEGTPASLAPVPGFAYPETAVRALGRAVERAEWLRRPVGVSPALVGIDRDGARALVDDALADAENVWLHPALCRSLLEAYGIPVVPERRAETPDEAASAAAELGFPVVVKTAAAGVHKSDVGGVALDLADEAAVLAAATRIGGPVVLQPMIAAGAELLAGVTQDPMFGPLVAFGPGGVLAELIGEAGFRLAPLSDVDALELVTNGKAGVLVRGFRGAPPADEAALVDLLLRLSQLADDLPEVAELDLNPVKAQPSGCIAVDSRIRLARPHPLERAKTW
jgi:acetate---CoA ligase (ADP-forming)